MEKREAEKLENARRKKQFDDYITSDEYQAKLLERLQITDACNSSAEARALMWTQCARPDNPAEGCIFFIETFGFTFDARPEHYPNHLPFFLFEFQKDAVRWIIDHIDNGSDGLLEKSRDMGVSWLFFVWVVLWYWLFRDGVNILIGSYKEQLVDSRTDDSLFGRIDYSLNSLPNWILPKRFNKNKHRTQMKLINPENNNLISGDTMNPDFGRGSRKTAVLFDELGSWDYAQDAWDSCADTTPCRIANSTPKGYNFYAILRKESGIDVLTLKWQLHPQKDQQWYDFEKTRRTPEVIAQELDISYTKSQEGVCYPEWANDSNVERGKFEYDENLPLYVGWDFGYTDDTAIIWAQPFRGTLRIIDTYKNNNKTIDFYVPFVTGITPSEGYKYSQTDLDLIEDHKYWKMGTHFGDPAGRFKNAVTEDTVLDVLKRNGIIVNFRDQWKEWSKRKNSAKRRMLDGIELNQNGRTKYFDIAMLNAAYPKVKAQGLEEVRSLKPKHDGTSHYRSAFEYLSLGLETIEHNVPRVRDRFPKRDTGGKRKALGY